MLQARKKSKRRLAAAGALTAALAAILWLSGCSSDAPKDLSNSASSSSNAGSETSASSDMAYGSAASADSSADSSDSSAAADSSAADSAPSSPAIHVTVDVEPGDGDSQGQQPQAGQLTGAEWNDNNHWNEWSKLMKQGEWRNLQDQWGFYLHGRVVVTVDEGGPIPDASVTVSNQSISWSAKTDMQGKAILFLDPFQPQFQKGTYQLSIDTGNGEKMTQKLSFSEDQGIDMTMDQAVKQDVPVSNNVDLMFLIDTTGSMTDELSYLQAELKNVAERLQKTNGQQLKLRLSSDFYRDHGDVYVLRSFPFTTDVDQVVQTIGKQHADGGGDYPEAVDEALDNAINDHDWSSQARARLLFVVLDAPPHQTGKIVKKMQELGKQAAAKGIRIIPVASSGVDESTEFLLRSEAIISGGTYIFLTDDSGIGDAHEQPTVGKYKVQKLNDLLVNVANRYISGQ